MSCWYQENIRGQMLELRIEEKNCENGEKCEEFISKVRNDRRQYGFMFGLTSAIVCLIMSIYLAIPTRFTDCFSLLCAFSSLSFIALTSGKLFFRVSSETVTYVPSTGIQHSIQFKCGIKSHTFIPAKDFSGVIINEDIGWDHAFYLAVLLKNSASNQKLLPLFKNTSPRLAFIQKVHNRILYLQDKNK
ncbi:uncharacterized protein LOC132196410 [Neocloeon triangulifer]|uniref:uncharacterized protein LOC132196410 n=1 Tax=Neocloeon triangulifer TaxID=2078957 RepID=UPI00286EE15B|nr:uncharacterized protein LOC132196410 [Neocloeon triangulifer]